MWHWPIAGTTGTVSRLALCAPLCHLDSFLCDDELINEKCHSRLACREDAEHFVGTVLSDLLLRPFSFLPTLVFAPSFPSISLFPFHSLPFVICFLSFRRLNALSPTSTTCSIRNFPFRRFLCPSSSTFSFLPSLFMFVSSLCFHFSSLFFTLDSIYSRSFHSGHVHEPDPKEALQGASPTCCVRPFRRQPACERGKLCQCPCHRFLQLRFSFGLCWWYGETERKRKVDDICKGNHRCVIGCEAKEEGQRKKEKEKGREPDREAELDSLTPLLGSHFLTSHHPFLFCTLSPVYFSSLPFFRFFASHHPHLLVSFVNWIALSAFFSLLFPSLALHFFSLFSSLMSWPFIVLISCLFFCCSCHSHEQSWQACRCFDVVVACSWSVANAEHTQSQSALGCECRFVHLPWTRGSWSTRKREATKSSSCSSSSCCFCSSHSSRAYWNDASSFIWEWNAFRRVGCWRSVCVISSRLCHLSVSCCSCLFIFVRRSPSRSDCILSMPLHFMWPLWFGLSHMLWFRCSRIMLDLRKKVFEDRGDRATKTRSLSFLQRPALWNDGFQHTTTPDLDFNLINPLHILSTRVSFANLLKLLLRWSSWWKKQTGGYPERCLCLSHSSPFHRFQQVRLHESDRGTRHTKTGGENWAIRMRTSGNTREKRW